MLRRVNAQGGPVNPDAPFASAVIDGDIMYVSGTGGRDPETRELPETFLGQAEQVLKNLTRVIVNAGGDVDKVVKCTCFITDMSQWGEFNKLFHQYLPCQPARSCVEVKALPGGMAIEIEAIVSMK